MSSHPSSTIFKGAWDLQFTPWDEADRAEEVKSTSRHRAIGWMRQKIGALNGKKEAIPPIKIASTRSFSDAGDEEKQNEIETKITAPPCACFWLWFNNRSQVQKVLYIIAAIIFVLVMISIIAVIGKEDSSKAASGKNGLTDKNFSFPDFDPLTVPPTSISTPDNFQNPGPSSSPVPTNSPTYQPEKTYVPGKLKTDKFGLSLSDGLDAKIIAFADEKITFGRDGKQSKDRFHKLPDSGATFEDDREDNRGGWIYVSNSNLPDKKGGVGALTFDREGNIIDYEIILKKTSKNCGGGETPWGTWISCEENGDRGRIFQVDAKGQQKAQEISIGRNGGNWNSFAYDTRNETAPRFFVTENQKRGALRRFVPDSPNWEKPSEMLHGSGTTEFLMLFPNSTNDGGIFVWTNDEEASRNNAEMYYPETEGIDVKGPIMYFVSNSIKQLFVLDLDSGTYYNETTNSGFFDGSPEQIEHILSPAQDLVYFTEQGGHDHNSGVHARDRQGRYHTVLESQAYKDTTTGLSFSPNGRFMYVAYQSAGLLFSIWRTDGYTFRAAHLDVEYHNTFFST
eukprot:scaffold1323_cov113-Cylindrotheca_fusiformis.AAC.9